MLRTLGLAALLASSATLALAQAKTLEPGQEVDMVLLPKFLGILVFDQAHEGAQEAHAELQNPGELLFQGRLPGIPADIGVDTRRRRVLVPQIAMNRVDVWALPDR